MKWTNDRPKIGGWYWYRFKTGEWQEPEIGEVVVGAINSKLRTLTHGIIKMESMRGMEVQFCGPIDVPKEQPPQASEGRKGKGAKDNG